MTFGDLLLERTTGNSFFSRFEGPRPKKKLKDKIGIIMLGRVKATSSLKPPKNL